MARRKRRGSKIANDRKFSSDSFECRDQATSNIQSRLALRLAGMTAAAIRWRVRETCLGQLNAGHCALLTNARDEFFDLGEDVAHHNGDALRRGVEPVRKVQGPNGCHVLQKERIERRAIFSR